MSNKIIISELETKDIRFPTSDSLIGSDAMKENSIKEYSFPNGKVWTAKNNF